MLGECASNCIPKKPGNMTSAFRLAVAVLLPTLLTLSNWTSSALSRVSRHPIFFWVMSLIWHQWPLKYSKCLFFFLTKRSAWCEHAILFCPFFGYSSFENGRCTVLSEQHCPFIVSHLFSSAYPGSGRGSSNLRREAQTSLTSFLGYCVQLFWRRPWSCRCCRGPAGVSGM